LYIIQLVVFFGSRFGLPVPFPPQIDPGRPDQGSFILLGDTQFWGSREQKIEEGRGKQLHWTLWGRREKTEERKEMEANEKRGGRGKGKREANKPGGGGMDFSSL
jgi:hypothetical protein